MTTWILQHFLNPAFFWPGAALLSAPIIIHLINRLRYRRVRFAAMEFLLASQKRNRRRLLIEQLLLLLLRCAIILLIVFLIARLVLDPSQLSLFQGAKSHHVLLLDDTASMQDQGLEGTAFDSAKEVLRRIISEGARRPGTQIVTLVLWSEPDKAIANFSERAVDQSLLAELGEQLETLACTYRTANPIAALQAAQRRLASDRSAMRQVHVLSDFRQLDWVDNQGAASVVQDLEKSGIGVNLVRCVADAHENLGIEELGGDVEVAAAGVPVSLKAVVRNWGQRPAENVRASVFVDGSRVPRTVDFQSIAPGATVERRFDVVFPAPRMHSVSLALTDDAFLPDNQRVLAVHVPVDHPVLIIDGSPGAEQAQYVADALAADKSVTGFSAETRSPEEFRRLDLDNYDLICLINVPDLAPDARAALERYVQQGGGLMWHLGDAVRSAAYQTLYDPQGSLFPVRLGPAPIAVRREDDDPRAGELQPANHPLFALFTDQAAPILDQVLINFFYPIAGSGDGPAIAPDARIIARINNEPLMLEHRWGQGRIFTSLTSAGPLLNPEGMNWNNWANGPASFSFVVFQLELARRTIRRDRSAPQQLTGEPIRVELNPAQWSPDVEIVDPEDRVTRIQASPASEGAETPLLRAVYTQTDLPGVYAVQSTDTSQQVRRELIAVNVPPREGALSIASDEAVLRELGPDTQVSIQRAGQFEWIRSESPGSEMRWLLLVALALCSLAEQLLASRMTVRGQE